MRKTKVILGLIAAVVILTAAYPTLPTTPDDYVNLNLPAHFTSTTVPFADVTPYNNTPGANPLTNNGATLGRVLFYDKMLSANNTISCGSCHQQRYAFSDTAVRSRGFNGGLTRRHGMSLVNVRWHMNGKMFWDERAASLEAQVLMPIQDNTEMGLTLTQLVQRVQQQPYYAQLFSNAFGDTAVTSTRISYALAQFVRSIVSHSSKYDIGRAQVTALNQNFPNFTSAENGGKNIYFRGISSGGGECFGCHTSEAFINAQFGPICNGIDSLSTTDLGGFEANTNDSTLIGRFKVSTLRNIQLTAPYMHDGRFQTLEQVVEHYSTGIKMHRNLSPRFVDTVGNTLVAHKFNWTATQKSNLVAFLKTLTDSTILTESKWSDPFTAVALPIELLDFTAAVKGGHSVELSWRTAAEENTSQFIVERSADGRSFTAVGSVGVNGSGALVKNYSLVDRTPLWGTTVYRLRIVSIIGSVSYSKIARVSLGDNADNIRVFPSPTAKTLTIEGANSEGTAALFIVNQLGKIVMMRSVQSGDASIMLDVQSLPIGQYTLTIQGSSVRRTARFSKL